MRAQGERGDTLVEILTAVTVLGIGITALLGGLVTNITATGANRSQAQVSTILLSASEYVKGLPSVTCGDPAETLDDNQVPHDEDVYTVSYGPASAFDASTPCTTMYRVPVQVVGDGFSVSLNVVKRP